MDIHQQILSRLNHLEHSRDAFAKLQANHQLWIEYLEAERKILMARIDDLEGIVSDIVNDYASRDEREKALEDRIGAATEKLRDAHATLMGQAAPEAAPEAPQAVEAPELSGQ